MKKYFLCAVLMVFTILATAQNRPARVPATPYPIDIVQPDSSHLTIRLHGDERMHFTTTLDGYEIRQAEDQFYYFIQIDKDGHKTLSHRVACNEADRSICCIRFLKKHGVQHKVSTR